MKIIFQRVWQKLCDWIEILTLKLAMVCGNRSYEKLEEQLEVTELQRVQLVQQLEEFKLGSIRLHEIQQEQFAALKRYCDTLKSELSLARDLRILAKAAFGHNQNVRFVSRHEVKLLLQKDFYDKILETVKGLEDINKEAHTLKGVLDEIAGD